MFFIYFIFYCIITSTRVHLYFIAFIFVLFFHNKIIMKMRGMLKHELLVTFITIISAQYVHVEQKY